MQIAAYRPRLTVTVAVAAFSIVLAPCAQAQNYWSYGQNYFSQQQRQYEMQQRRAQRQQEQVAREAAARERRPHEVSSSYTGNLAPFTDLTRVFSGKTVYLERPIVSNGQVVRWEAGTVFFASDGRSYSEGWFGRPWVTEQNDLCLGGVAPENCWQVFHDDARQLFFLTPKSILMHVARVESGDSADARAQYAQARRQAQTNNAVAGAVVLGLLGAMMSSGEGDTGNDNLEGFRRQQMDIDDAMRERAWNGN